jgi:uncharacterized protein (DUF488 family)
MHEILTIGYEGATVDSVLNALTSAGVSIVADIRAVASSRRPGFSKRAFSESVAAAGMDYIHLRDLGTPADGRAAARAGRHAEMRAIFLEHMATPAAHEALVSVAEMVEAGRRVCLLCYEADHRHCHRSIVAELLQPMVQLTVKNLRP